MEHLSSWLGTNQHRLALVHEGAFEKSRALTILGAHFAGEPAELAALARRYVDTVDRRELLRSGTQQLRRNSEPLDGFVTQQTRRSSLVDLRVTKEAKEDLSLAPSFAGEVYEEHGRLFARNLLDASTYPLATGSSASPGSIMELAQVDGPARTVAKPVETLAEAGDVRTKLYKLAAEHGLNPVFSPESKREVRAFLENPGIDDPELTDLTDLEFLTIDNEDSKDLDQAMYVERDGDDYVVYYALADASYYAPPGSALFDEVMQRGATYYMPGLAIRMMPKELSEGVCSLNPNVDRRAMLVKTRLDKDGQVLSTELDRVRIRSRAKLSYDGVQAHMDGKETLDGTWTSTLDLLKEVGEKRMADANRRGVVSYHRLEDHMSIRDGKLVVTSRARNDVEKYNEQISLLANMEGARFSADGVDQDHLQPIFRIHGDPPGPRLGELRTRIRGIVAQHGLDPDRWEWKRGQSLSEYLAGLPSTEPLVRITRAINRQAVVVNKASVFSSEPEPHYGVGADVYARFTSPMREAVGIFTHKEAYEKLDQGLAWRDNQPDIELQEQIIDLANEAKKKQKELDKAVKELFMDELAAEQLELPEAERQTYGGTVMGVTSTRAYVVLDDPPLEVKVYLDDLVAQCGQDLAVDDARSVLKSEDGSFRLRVGDAVAVEVAGYDDEKQRWQFDAKPREARAE